ncbi:hypothetical protein [Propioniciclava tarda]|uniref:Uncharacterized protein n=1 Tax=Propioniciclava tarda TaxID=433330 RepID=A0A4Q9KMW3_PROTD|nr:hypothetical protein [Propioniciclava tarda]TBT95916.1 hypothetical protein ET996_02785 [Propioniciclava tarda]SMO41405.1 hypothetical protein SAMN06266982_102175 [Propioniciclava tarda]
MTQTVERMLPLYEGKMGLLYDHRYASFRGVGDTDIEANQERQDDSLVLPRYWVREEVVADRLVRRTWGSEAALLGHRRVARNTDERTIIASFIPFGAASYGWILSAGPDARALALLVAQYNSFALDYILRQFLSQPSIPQGTFGQLPTLPPDVFARLDPLVGNGVDWVVDRVAVLVGSGIEMHAYVRELGREYLLPVEWDQERRAACRVELDAAMFLLLGVERADVEHIMDTFPIVKRKDVAAFGSFRTKELILDVYDAMEAAIDAGRPYVSPLADLLAGEQGRGAISPYTQEESECAHE